MMLERNIDPSIRYVPRLIRKRLAKLRNYSGSSNWYEKFPLDTGILDRLAVLDQP